MSEFKILSQKEEKTLSNDELKEYYNNLRKEIINRKTTNTTPGATTIAPKLKAPTNKIAVAVTKAFTDKEVEWVYEGTENIPDGPVIYAHTHQGLIDGFVWIPEIDEHCLILHSAVTRKLLLLCQLNSGLILVKKGNKENCKNAKLDMIKHLLNGHSIAYFPESAWCLSPNKLHLPMSYGFLDTARKAGVPVIPVVHEFTYDIGETDVKITKIHSVYDKPLYISIDDSIEERLLEYEEIISTIKYRLFEEKGLFKREEIDPLEYKKFLDANIKHLKMGGIDINVERENLFGANDDFYIFHHINDVPCSKDGTLLETKEVRRLKELNLKHGIYSKY